MCFRGWAIFGFGIDRDYQLLVMKYRSDCFLFLNLFISKVIMKEGEKDGLNKTMLNETALSLNNVTNGLETTFLEKNCPLHSHQILGRSKSSFTSGLRILDMVQKPETKLKREKTKGEIVKKFAFGSSETRKVKIFEPNVKNSNQHPQITLLSPIKNRMSSQPQELPQHHKNGSNKMVTRNENQTQVGFGVCSFQSRFEISPQQRACPGPGTYEISQSFNKIKNKRVLPSFAVLNLKEEKENIQGQSLIELGDTRQISLPLERRRDLNQIRQKWKQKIIQKKQKTNELFAKIMPKPKQKFLNLEEQVRWQESELRNIDTFYQNEKEPSRKEREPPGKSPKLYRVQLKEKTNAFLPRVQSQIFETNYNARGPTYKYLFSNSFIKKNDHAFEAHSYKPSDPQSEYIFFHGKTQLKPPENENSSFKSKVQRKVF